MVAFPGPDYYPRRPAPPPPVQTYNTQDYVSVVRAADTQGFKGTGGPDGEVSIQELDAYKNTLQQQLGLVKFMQTFFGPFFGGIFDRISQEMSKRLDVANIMSNNYDAFANPNGYTHIRPPGITEANVRTIAARDGNANDVSNQDIFNIPKPPIQPKPPTSPWDSLIELLRRFGFISSSGPTTPEPVPAAAQQAV